MKTIQYPLLYYPIKGDVYLGLLVGTDHQVVDKSVLDIKNTLKTYLQKQYKKLNDYPYIDLMDIKLRILNVKIRPTYRSQNANFPVNKMLSIPIPLVYGQTADGYFECHLPLFEESFIYYDQKQFTTLSQHFATYLLNRKSPEQLYKLLTYEKPQLDFVPLRVNNDREYYWDDNFQERNYAILSKMAVRYPYSKAVRRKISAFPDAAWEQEHKVDALLDKLVTVRTNVLLVGKHGVGKSSILKQAIRKLITASKKNKYKISFWQLMSQRITAGAKYLGDWQETVEKLVEELNSSNGVLWVVDIIQLLLTGGYGPEDSVAAFLISFLQSGRLQIVGEVTEEELESMRRMLPGFTENFQIIHIAELPEDKVLSILEKFAAYSSSNLKIDIRSDALDLTFRLLKRYFPYESFPGKAVNFLATCVSNAELTNQKVIDSKAIIDNFIKQTGLPELFLRDDMLLDQNELNHYFETRIIGQSAAIEQLSGIVKIFKAGLNNPNKPISTLIFAGPTGVGKTASAHALADYFFGKGQKKSPMIRIDMSEFRYPGQITRLIGAGREVGKLVQDIREQKFTVLLLDEVEKAAPSIFDALLAVLDEGILVDAYGRVTNFRNTIIIMTTNLGSSNRDSIGFGNTSTDSSQFESAISRHFRPEFMNRIDGIVIFNTLGQKDINAITLKELQDLKKREGFTKRHIKLDFTQNLIDHIAKNGFNEKYGARPLQRTVEYELVNPLAAWLLENPAIVNRTLQVDYQEKLSIELV